MYLIKRLCLTILSYSYLLQDLSPSSLNRYFTASVYVFLATVTCDVCCSIRVSINTLSLHKRYCVGLLSDLRVKVDRPRSSKGWKHRDEFTGRELRENLGFKYMRGARSVTSRWLV